LFIDIIKTFIRSNFATERKKEIKHIRQCSAPNTKSST
jgi:hypothetical protein